MDNVTDQTVSSWYEVDGVGSYDVQTRTCPTRVEALLELMGELGEAIREIAKELQLKDDVEREVAPENLKVKVRGKKAPSATDAMAARMQAQMSPPVPQACQCLCHTNRVYSAPGCCGC